MKLSLPDNATQNWLGKRSGVAEGGTSAPGLELLFLQQGGALHFFLCYN